MFEPSLGDTWGGQTRRCRPRTCAPASSTNPYTQPTHSSHPRHRQVLYTTHDWALVFEVAAGLYALGAVAYLQFASCEEQFTPASLAAQGVGPTAAPRSEAR